MSKANNSKIGCLWLFFVFVVILVSLFIVIVVFLYQTNELLPLLEDLQGWVEEQSDNEPTVEPIPPITPALQIESESISPNEVVTPELTDTTYPGFG